MILKYYILNYIVLNLLCIISSSIIYLCSKNITNYPKDSWNYLGNIDFKFPDFLYSNLLLIIYTILVSLILYKLLNFIENYYQTKILPNKNTTKQNSSNKLSIDDKNNKYIIAVSIIYLFLILIARIYGVDIVFTKENISGVCREIIFYGYRIILPLILTIFILTAKELSFSKIVYYICLSLLAAFISGSRIPLMYFYTSVIFKFIEINELKNSIKKLIPLFIFLIISIMFISIYRGYQNTYNSADANKENTYINFKTFNMTIESMTKFSLVNDVPIKYYDWITLPLSRVNSNTDLILPMHWKIKEEDIPYLIINKFGGLTLKKYNYSEEMRVLFEFKPKEQGSMAALNPTGVILGIFNNSLYGALFITMIIVLILTAIYTTLLILKSRLDISDKSLAFFGIIIFVVWLWIHPRLGLIYVAMIYLLNLMILLKEKFNNLIENNIKNINK